MKVLCVQKANFRNNIPSSFSDNLVKENEIYTVVGEKQLYGWLWYFLEGFDSKELFSADMFIPVSEIDEVKVHNDKFLKEDLW